MTTRTWEAPPEGPRVSYAWNNPANWGPVGVPQAGDDLIMAVGQMSIDHAKLPAELHLGTNGLSVGPTTLDMDGSSATVGIVSDSTYLNFAHPLTIDASGQDRLTADNLSAVQGTVNIAANSNLVVTGKMHFEYFGHLTGDGTITNNGNISIADGDISDRINGHGTLELHNYHDGTGSQTITGAIGGGQNVVLVAHTQNTVTTLVHPETFKGSLEIADSFNGVALGSNARSDILVLDGIGANQISMKGDMMRLLDRAGNTVWQDHVKMPAGYTASIMELKGATQIEFVPHPLVG